MTDLLDNPSTRVGPRTERGGWVFSLDAIEVLRAHWQGGQSLNHTIGALREAGFFFSDAQVREGAKRYCVAPVAFGSPTVLDMRVIRGPTPDRVRLVRPGTFPARNFSMLGGRVV